jgi:hypothetical protein
VYTQPSAVASNVAEFVLGNDLGRDDAQWKAHVFVAIHGGAQVEVADVENSKACIWGGNGAVNETFCRRELGGGCAHIAGILKAVATNG